RCKRKETSSSKEVLFTKSENSSTQNVGEITSNTKSDYDNPKPLPPLPKLSRAEPLSTSKDVIPYATLVQTSTIPDKTKQALMFPKTFIPCKYCGFNDHHSDEREYYPGYQDFLNAAASGNLLEKSPQDALTIIENKSKVRNSRSKPIASPVNACDNHSSSEIAKLTHAVNQQPCLAAGGNTFLEFRDNIQGYVSTATGNYNQGNPCYRPQGVANQMRPPGFAQPNVQNNQNRFGQPQGFNRAITTRSGLATDGPTVPTPLKSVNPKEDEYVEETYTDPDLVEYTIKVPPPPALVLMPKYQKMLKALLYDKEKLQELANIPLNENCSAIILKKLPEKLEDLGKFLIPCGFSELKYKALADLGASINLMPLSVWKRLGLPDLIPTWMTLELSNRAICTPDGITRDVFVPVGKFTFSADFVVVDYESDPRVPLILGRPFLRTARALIDVHGKEMILRDGDERLTLNMKHDAASYSNHPYRDSVNLINIFNLSSEDCFEDLVPNKQSGNPTFSLHKEIASPEVTHEIYDSKGCTFLSEELPDIDSYNDIHPYFDDVPISGSTLIQLTRCLRSSLMNLLLSHILRIMIIILRVISNLISEK
nr:reverse transcriptase domain-containing protein [Tanacetum cinerariifolium]GEY37264.1 reverse transcriptase domain-containing protein [Tanacetum cinerariifolium]